MQDVDNTRKRFVRAMSVTSMTRHEEEQQLAASIEVRDTGANQDMSLPEDDQSHVCYSF